MTKSAMDVLGQVSLSGWRLLVCIVVGSRRAKGVGCCFENAFGSTISRVLWQSVSCAEQIWRKAAKLPERLVRDGDVRRGEVHK